ARGGYGLLECPDLFEMVDPVSGRRTWVLAASADAARTGGTTGLAYWTGAWDGERFTADADEPQWLDGGADFYAAVTWDDPR
ncbi:levanase, partial [Klebsiella pneumoniae]